MVQMVRPHIKMLIHRGIAVFILFTGEDWDSVMSDALAGGGSHYPVPLYFIVVYAIGNYLVRSNHIAIT